MKMWIVVQNRHFSFYVMFNNSYIITWNIFVQITDTFFSVLNKRNIYIFLERDFPLVRLSLQIFMQHFVICSRSSSAHLVNLLRRLPATGGKLDNLLHLLARLL
jgi:hypothetical protein